MKYVFFCLIVFFSSLSGFSQVHKSIHKEQCEFYSNLGEKTEKEWDLYNQRVPTTNVNYEKATCNLNKVVFGFHPYWNGTTYYNYNWSLLSDLSYFSYEVDAATGNAVSTHSWSTTAVVDSAKAHGVRVNLAVTLFSSHATFLGNATAVQTLITNLINMVQQRGANGVNIDFEGVPSTQKTAFTTFMINLCNQMHSAIPGSQISIDIPAVDWGPNYDVTAMNPYVDLFIIMGYDYYYGGSSQAGPCAPLYSLTTGYNYCYTKTINYYLNIGVTASKLIMAVPYYGKQWATTDNSVPSSTTATGTSVVYKTIRTNSSGNYSTRLWNNSSFTPYWAYQSGTQWYQAWVDDALSLGKRYDMINYRKIGGTGMWALGYDDGYPELWNKIKEKFTNCATTACSDSIFDMGGPEKNYYDKENYTYTIAPTGASSLSLNFSSFNLETNYDSLWIYDGSTISSTLIGKYTGVNSPGTVNSTGNALTLRFKSDNTTNTSGWRAIWQCNQDNIVPTTTISSPGTWKTGNFTATFTDTDNSGGSGIEKSYYQVLENQGTEWRANKNNGFFADNFDVAIHSDWTSSTGNWSISNGMLYQNDTTNSNTNIYATLNQGLSNRYLYNFTVKYTGNTIGKRFGFHFFSNNGSLANRGNSYFIFFRTQTSKLEFYKVRNDVFTQAKVIDNIVTTADQLYDIKIIYDRTTGKMDVYRDDALIGTWSDTLGTQYTTGNYISFRTGNSKMYVNELKTYRSRAATANITVGSATTNDIRYQNTSPATFGAKIKSIVNDLVGNLSSISYHDLNIDWTAPTDLISVSDGLSSDVDTIFTNNQLTANWSASTDPNSGILRYWYCIGSTIGGTQVLNWTDNGTSLNFTANGLSLTYGQTYYVSVKVENAAGLFSTVKTSDGIYIKANTGYAISGVLNYNNSALTPLGLTTINLMNGLTPVASTTSNAGGNYSFSNIANGSYTITASTSLPWSGVTATDALKMKRHIASLEFLTEPIRLTSADVNESTSINSTDVLKVQRRIASLDFSFTRPDWIFEKPSTGGNSISVNGANVIQNMFALCTGDVNGSYIPVLMKKKPTVSMDYSSSIRINSNETFDLPVRISQSAEIGAMQLFLNYPAEKVEIINVSINSKNDELIFNAVNGKISIVWSSINPLFLNTSDAMFTIKLKAISNSGNISFNLLNDCELADGNGNIIDGVELFTSSIEINNTISYSDLNDALNSISIYPNPSINIVYIDFNKLSSQEFSVSLFNILGKQINILSKKENNRMKLNFSEFPDGLYVIQINSSKETITKKILIKR